MEEFYRRKYLSPSYSRPGYTETVEKDKTVTELRKQLQDCKQMQQKFDDLCLEIVKLQRENKKIESEQSQIQGEYLQKIKKNKVRITQLKQLILDCREAIESKSKKIALMQSQNDKLTSQLQRLKKDQQTNSKDTCDLLQKITSQQTLLSELKAKIQSTREQCIQTKKENQLKSNELERDYQQLKKKQLKLKQQELSCENQRNELQLLLKERQNWQQKIAASQANLLSAQTDLQFQKKQSAKTDQLHQQMRKQQESLAKNYQNTKQEARQCLLANKQNSAKLANNHTAMLQASMNLQKDQAYLQKTNLKELQLKKGNERLEQVLKQLTEMLGEEQQCYNRIIGHMKQSIQQDEKAIECLSKQATQLQTIIN